MPEPVNLEVELDCLRKKSRSSTEAVTGFDGRVLYYYLNTESCNKTLHSKNNSELQVLRASNSELLSYNSKFNDNYVVYYSSYYYYIFLQL